MSPAVSVAVAPSPAFIRGVASKRRKRRVWDFQRRFELFLADQGMSLNGFAKQAGLPQSSLHAYVKQGARIPVDAMQKIALATGLSIDYWVSDKPYPPPAEVAKAELEDALQGLTTEELEDLAAIMSDQKRRARFFRIWRAASED